MRAWFIYHHFVVGIASWGVSMAADTNVQPPGAVMPRFSLPSWALPIFAKRWSKCLFVAVVCLVVALLANVFRLDPDVAGKWSGYHYGNEELRFRSINLPADIGAAGAVVDVRDEKTLHPLEDHSSSLYFDDIGYILLPQLYVSVAGPIQPADMLAFHNGLFCFSMIAIAVMLTLTLNSALAGIIAYGLFLPLHRLFAGFIYHTASQPGLVVPMVAFAIACLIGLVFTIRNSNRLWLTLLIAGSVGALAGLIMLVRYPIGQGVILTSYASAIVLGITWKRRAAIMAALFVGFWITQSGLIGVVAMSRDAQLHWKRENPISYFRGPPHHEPWFALLASIGRYENAIGVTLKDSAVDDVLSARKAAEPARWPKDYDEIFDTIARDVLIDYIRANPGEFLAQRVEGTLELFWVAPGVTFMSKDLFAGSPWISPQNISKVDKRDVRPSQENLLINVRLQYLELTPLQWGIFGLAVLSFFGTVAYTIVSWKRQAGPSRAFSALLVLWLLYAATRALIPWYGQDFVFSFWVISALGAAWLLGDLVSRLLKRGVDGSLHSIADDSAPTPEPA